jgi:hypothetical protein
VVLPSRCGGSCCGSTLTRTTLMTWRSRQPRLQRAKVCWHPPASHWCQLHPG